MLEFVLVASMFEVVLCRIWVDLPLCCWSVSLLLFHLLCCLVAVVVSYVPYTAVLLGPLFVVCGGCG